MKKSRLRPYFILACTLQLIAILFYLIVPNVHLIVLSSYALVLSWLFYQAQKSLPLKRLLLLSAALALELTLVIQILGHTLFSGLAKDVSFFSIENAANSLKLSFVMFGLYNGWLLALRCLSRVISPRQDTNPDPARYR